MVPDLRGVVEKSTSRAPHDVLEALTLPVGPGREFVEVVHIRSVVFAVVVGDGLG